MKIKCIDNRLEILSVSERRTFHGYQDGLNNMISIGDEFIVYSIMIVGDQIMYFTADEFCSVFYRHYAKFFEIIDNRISKYWKIYQGYNHSNEFYVIITFLDLTNFPDAWDNLINVESHEIEQLKHYKELMDKEFID
jgi:hypothetical protein